jgi:GcrA cell cycle regulator
MDWTNEAIERLKMLWAGGMTARNIAMEFGCTKNSVIGKVHRLGLEQRGSPLPREANSRYRPSRIVRTTRQAVARPVVIAPLPDITALAIVPDTPMPAIMSVRNGLCRWPIGNPPEMDFRFCLAAIRGDQTYCSHHTRMAYQSPAQRTADKKARVSSHGNIY